MAFRDLKSLSMLFGKSVGFTGFLFRLLHVFVKIDTIGLFYTNRICSPNLLW